MISLWVIVVVGCLAACSRTLYLARRSKHLCQALVECAGMMVKTKVSRSCGGTNVVVVGDRGCLLSPRLSRTWFNASNVFDSLFFALSSSLRILILSVYGKRSKLLQLETSK